MTIKDSARLSIRLDNELNILLSAREKKENITRSELIRKILTQELNGRNSDIYLKKQLSYVRKTLHEMLKLVTS